MTEDEQRMKNLVLFKVPVTDAELGLDKPMPTWAVCFLIGGIFIILAVVGIAIWRGP